VIKHDVIARRSSLSTGPARKSAGPNGHFGMPHYVRGDRGASPVELAILMPAIVVLLFASIQLAVYFLARSEALAAAQEGVTAQRAYQAPTCANGSTSCVGAKQATTFINQSQGWLVSGVPSVTTDATQVTVVVTGKSLALIPGIDWTVTQTAHGTIERVTPPS
jgi:Flp pilus assembly protein TadG